MATKTLESRFEHLTVHDENEAPPTTTTTLLKSKVRDGCENHFYSVRTDRSW